MMHTSQGLPHYSVGQLNHYIQSVISGDFLLQHICVEGEVSNLKYHHSGHIYFTLKDAGAAVNAVMFRSYAARGLDFQMSDGQRVLVYGKVDVYEAGGTYQLYAQKIEEAGRGDLYREYELRKKKFEEMGYFSELYKRSIPPYAMRVGIVTAPDGAAIQDIIKVTRTRNPYVQLILSPAQVQGKAAAPSIARAIERLDRLHPDVMIVGRGGGSIEDLWAFNEEEVVEAIFNCSTPVISAVGHETDFTLADFAADHRSPTPSAAAEKAVFEYKTFELQLEGCRDRLTHLMRDRIRQSSLKLSGLDARLRSHRPAMELQEKRHLLENMADKMRSLVQKQLQTADLDLDRAENAISGAMHAALEMNRHRLELLSGTLDAHSPLKRLAAGYGYLQDRTGKGIVNISQLKTGDAFSVFLRDGRIEAAVQALKEEDFPV